MMQRNRLRESPAHRRSRSRTPGGRKKYRASIAGQAAEAQQEDELQVLSPPDHSSGGGRLSVFPNSSGPQSSSDSFTKNDSNADNQQGLLRRLSGVIYDRVALKEKNEDLKQANEALRARNKKLEERNKALHQDISSLKRVVELEAAECKELRARLDQLEQTSASHPRSASESPKKREIKPSAGWQEKIDGYKRRFQELVAENSRLLHQTSEQENLIRAQTTSFARELEATRGAGFVKMQRISDTEIQSKWKALCFAVRQFVTTHLPEALDLKTVQVLLQQQEFKWLPEAAKTLQSPVFCSIILESWVWHFLCFRIFDCCSSFWAGELGKELCALNERVGGRITELKGQADSQSAAVSQFHEWRVRSAHFIVQLGTHDKNSSARLTADMLRLLKHTIPGPQAANNKSMYEDALDIVHKAAGLDRIFRLSRAHFHVFITRVKLPLVNPPSFGFQFDVQTMERISDIPMMAPADSEPTVDLAVSPGIFKAGNSAGANYNSERLLVKLRALCGLQDTLAVLDEESVTEEEINGEHQMPIKQEQEQDDIEMRCP